MSTPKPKKGGARPGAGRKKNLPPAVVEAKLDGRTTGAKQIAGRVLEDCHAGELWRSMIAVERERLGINPDGTLGAPPVDVEKDADGKVIKTIVRGRGNTLALSNLLRYLEDRHYGRPVDTVNHVHDKPIDLNVNLTLRTRMQRAEERFKNALATRARN